MKISGIDLETTGIDHSKGERIVEISIITADSEDWSKQWKTFEWRCNPRKPIQAGATAVHGITDVDVASSPFFEDIVDDVLKACEGTDVLVAHNMEFDGPFFASELERVGKDIEGEFKLFCTMQNARWATGTGKWPNLGELCFACGVDYNPALAHGALYDTDRMMRCLRHGLNKGWYVL